MDPKIAERYNDDILNQAMDQFGIDLDKIKLLDGFESFIYEFSRQDGDFILRVGHSLRRTQELILGEVDWINFLAAGGAGVARAILSDAGRLVEFVDDGYGDCFMVTAFEKADGGSPTDDLWNQNLFQAWGRLLGRIHVLTKDYQPTNPDWRREEWDSPGNMLVEAWLPSSETAALDEFKNLLNHFAALPKDRNSYGLIHQDAHAGNFYVNRDYKITLFDFDDCVYSWFIYDIAMVLFYSLMDHENDPVHIEHFTHHFLKGYSQENILDTLWLAEIPYFLKLREIDLYAQIIFSYGGMDKVDDPWCLNYMDGRKEIIENGSPYINYDWTSLAEHLIVG
jgi:Ser/Thr protein kinase RdoA (MazF antagonist)